MPAASEPAVDPAPGPHSGAPRRWPLLRGPLRVTSGTLILCTAVFWAVAANRGLLVAALRDRSGLDPSAWTLGLAIAALVIAAHVLLMAVAAPGRLLKPMLAALTVAAAAASYFQAAYGVVIDPTMIRSVLHTDPAETRELLTGGFALHLAVFGGLPLALLWRVELIARPWWRGLLARAGVAAAAVVVIAATAWSAFQPLASLVRNRHELRYMVTPLNVVWSVGAVAASATPAAARAREPLGLDAAPGPSWAARGRPMVVVVVVGETARAANWGLNGYARQTTPRLSGLPVVNFPRVESCGTNTEVSLPCMFAPVGRRQYDEARIRGSESLLHLLARAGVAVHWRDNQSGCKGVCDGLPFETVSVDTAPDQCRGGRCLDAALVDDLDRRLAAASGTHLWVLHMLGNHGPAYHRRYPESFARFRPECRDDDLRRCSIEEIVNAYDNAILYTDHVLATAIETLRAHAHRVDSALVFVSDHGESLGERGLFLHGVPYRFAPQEQVRVPMVWWTSTGFEAAAGLDQGCLTTELQRQAAGAVSHDHLFHTLVGLLDVTAGAYDAGWDLAARCRPGRMAAGAAVAR